MYWTTFYLLLTIFLVDESDQLKQVNTKKKYFNNGKKDIHFKKVRRAKPEVEATFNFLPDSVKRKVH